MFTYQKVLSSKSVLYTAMALTLIGCQKKEKKSNASVELQLKPAFLSSADLEAPANLNQISKMEISTEIIEFLSSEFATSVDGNDGSDDSSDFAIPASIGADQNNISLAIDFETAVEEGSPPFRIQMFMHAHCINGNASPLNGMSGNLGDEALTKLFFENCESIQHGMISSQSSGSSTYEFGDKTYNIISKFISYKGGDQFSLLPPSENTPKQLPSNYIFIEVSSSKVNDDPESSEYIKLTPGEGGAWALDENYIFTEGVMNITLNNWTGTLRIVKENDGSPPGIDYDLTSSNGEKATGRHFWSLPSSNLSLQGKKPRNQLKANISAAIQQAKQNAKKKHK